MSRRNVHSIVVANDNGSEALRRQDIGPPSLTFEFGTIHLLPYQGDPPASTHVLPFGAKDSSPKFQVVKSSSLRHKWDGICMEETVDA